MPHGPSNGPADARVHSDELDAMLPAARFQRLQSAQGTSTGDGNVSQNEPEGGTAWGHGHARRDPGGAGPEDPEKDGGEKSGRRAARMSKMSLFKLFIIFLLVVILAAVVTTAVVLSL